jgi:hypothetical protein
MLLSLLHFVFGITGLVLVWIALFLTETEEGSLQNRLEKLWVRVDDLSKTAMTKEGALIQQTSGMVSRGLDRLFGKKLWSWKAVATSAGLSVVSLVLGLNTIMHLNHRKIMGDGSAVLLCLLAAGVLASLAPGRLRYATFLLVCFTPTLLFVGLQDNVKVGTTAFLSFFTPSISRDLALDYSLGAFGGGVLCDVLVIMIIRWLSNTSSELTKTWKLVGFALLNVSIGVAILAPAPVVVWSKRITGYGAFDVLPPYLPPDLIPITLGIGASNLLTALACFLIVLLLAAALLHRAVWPAVSRPIYAAQRYGLVSHPKLLGALGASCLLFAWPHSPLAVLVAKLLHLPD